jgi:hypothetical protein
MEREDPGEGLAAVAFVYRERNRTRQEGGTMFGAHPALSGVGSYPSTEASEGAKCGG